MGTVSVKSESTVNRRLSQGICKGKSINIDQNAPKVTHTVRPMGCPMGHKGEGEENVSQCGGTLFNFEYKWSANAFVCICSGTFLKKLYSDPNVNSLFTKTDLTSI